MTDFPWLTLAIALPAAGSLAVALLPRERIETAKRTALGVTAATLVLVAAMALQFAPGGDRLQFTEVYPWIPRFGISYAVGVDGIALVLILMSVVLVPLVVLAAWRENDDAPDGGKGYFALILVLEAMMIGVFAATDVFLFYVFFEAMLIPVYFMIGRYGRGDARRSAAIKFLLYSLLGGLLMLVAVIGVYVYGGTFRWSELVGETGALAAVDPTAARLMFLGFFVALRSRRRCGRCTPGCPRRPGPRGPAPPCCWSACWTRSAPTPCCATAWRCSPPRPPGSSGPWWCSAWSASSTAPSWLSRRAT